MQSSRQSTNRKPKLYVDSIKQHQQEQYRMNYLQQLLNEQKEMNGNFLKNVQSMTTDLQNHKVEQFKSLNELTAKLSEQEYTTNEIVKEVKRNDINHNEIMNRLQHLESLSTKIEKMIDDEQLLNEASVEQLAFLEQLTQKLVKRIDEYHSTQQSLHNHIENQDELLEKMNDKLEIQEMFHKSIIERFDKQEVTNRKILNQLDGIKTSIVEKIETVLDSLMFQYKHTIQYIKEIVVTKPNVVHRLQVKQGKGKEEKQKKNSI
ncbi:hypothetical protein ACWE42_03095 [Sutcliffiella cohnii]